MNWEGRGTRQERGYGARWQKLRSAVMRRDMWFCQPCLRNGRYTPAAEVDHVTPKFEGGTDQMDNLQAICRQCHSAKTKEESARGQQELRDQGRRHVAEDGWPVEPEQFGYSIPHGLQPAQRRVEIVCGPPCSGKSTYVKQRARPADKVIDLDDIIERLGGNRHNTDKVTLRKAFRWRDMAIRGLCRPHNGKAWLIVTAPTKDERNAWLRALGDKASLTVMDTSAAECIARLEADPERAVTADAMRQVIEAYER